eukprot:m.26516 g.26516  ORF g.26516 m.26516 type:complete len:341 (+) comp6323_c0_seq2:66-1088(+)
MWQAVVLAAIGVVTLAANVPDKMSAVIVTGPCVRPNFTTCLSVVQRSTPKALPGEVIVKINSSSVNPSDLDMAISLGKDFGVYGIDFAGEVVEVGAGCPKHAVGDHVWGASKGTYADYAFALCAITGSVPSNVPMVQAGTVPEVGTTSVEALKKLGAPWDPSKNLTIVITSGSGGTGLIGVQLAKAFGAGTVVTAASGADNIALVKSFGADVVIDYKVENIFDSMANNSIDLVFDNYGAKGSADRAMPKMKDPSVYLLLPGGEKGTLSKNPKPGVKQINYGEMIPSLSALDQLKTFFEAGKLRTHVQATYPLSRIIDAFAESATGTVVGKLAVVPDEIPQ